MRFLVLIALIGAVVWALRRSLRAERYARLGLRGRWRCRDESGEHELVLRGDVDGGSYEERSRSSEGARRERGRWRVTGEAIEFEAESGARSTCELRAFAPGRIGLHGPGRSQRVYERV